MWRTTTFDRRGISSMADDRDGQRPGRALTQAQRVFADQFAAKIRGRLISPGAAVASTVPSFAWLLMDCSTSMAGGKMDQAKRGALEFTQDAVKRGYKVGVIAFANAARRVCDFTMRADVLDRAVSPLVAEGSTNLAGGLE